MDLSRISPEKQALLERIHALEQAGDFHADAELDPPAPPLLLEQVDYLCKKPSNRMKRSFANLIGDCYFKGLIKKGELIIDGVVGTEHLYALQNGAVITCNHFSPTDNYAVYYAIRKYLPKKYLYKVIREGNYTGFSGLYGFLFRHCNTLPLSSNRRIMINFYSAVQTLLKNRESILIYPEQSMWWNYRKPRPFKVGAFKIAHKAQVPIVPIFITMTDDKSKLDKDGYPLQRYTVRILPPVYPDGDNAEEMQQRTYALYQSEYERVYGEKLTFTKE